jgi:hypothetical protein
MPVSWAMNSWAMKARDLNSSVPAWSAVASADLASPIEAPEVAKGKLGFRMLRSRFVFGTRPEPASEFRERDPETGRNLRDMILGLALAVGISASFWTGVGLTVARLMR